MVLSETQNEILFRFSRYFERLAKEGAYKLPASKISFAIKNNDNKLVKQAARKAYLQSLSGPQLTKVAFDTRETNQETQRNPRSNLQYWHRTNAFIDESTQEKLQSFSKLMTVLSDIKESYGSSPEYHESYSRVLYDHVERILRLKQGDTKIFSPQLAYLEQLLYTRYRLSPDNINKLGELSLRKAILEKDEPLLKRGVFLNQTGGLTTTGQQIVIDGKQKDMQQGLVEAIFGGDNKLRRDGEKSVERVITIKIQDTVLE